jgi:hypothetical protein
MKGLAVMHRLTPEVSLYDQTDEAADRQGEHHRGRGQRDRQDRAPDLSFTRLPQGSSPLRPVKSAKLEIKLILARI